MSVLMPTTTQLVNDTDSSEINVGLWPSQRSIDPFILLITHVQWQDPLHSKTRRRFSHRLQACF